MNPIDNSFRYRGPHIKKNEVLMTYDEFVRTFQPIVVVPEPKGTINDFVWETGAYPPDAVYNQIGGSVSRHTWSIKLREKVIRSATVADAGTTKYSLFTRRAPYALSVVVGAVPTIER